MKKLELPGLGRLMHVCGRLGLRVVTKPPGRHPPVPLAPIEGTPLDPLLASFYSMMGKGNFAPDADGLVMFEMSDEVNALEEKNRAMRDGWQSALFSSLFIFGGEPFLAHYYATVPGLADEHGRQPVVWVDAYEQGYALPVASNVDCLFDTYSRYLEELVAHEDFRERGSAALAFPWRTPHLLVRDEPLLRLIREGHFERWLPGQEGKDWTSSVLAARQRHS